MDPLTTGGADQTWIRQDVSLTARARRAAADLARRIGMPAERISQIELAVTEVAVNLAHHADDGAMLLRLVETGPQVWVEVVAIDHGPGIADLDDARRAGVSTGGTPGLGLGVVERMADTLDIHSLMGRGTVLVARFRQRPATAEAGKSFGEPTVAGLTRALSGEQVCGDAWGAKLLGSGSGSGSGNGSDQSLDADSGVGVGVGVGQGPASLSVMLCDGLGHGPLASRASSQALTSFHRTATEDPKDLITEMHRALAGTRGGAGAVARIDWHRRRIDFCGIGNISAFIVADDARSALLSSPGIVGHHLPRLRGHEAELPPGATVVFHSDGLTERWSPKAMPSLFRASSTVIAAHLLREAGVRRDDASVVVVKDPQVLERDHAR